MEMRVTVLPEIFYVNVSVSLVSVTIIDYIHTNISELFWLIDDQCLLNGRKLL